MEAIMKKWCFKCCFCNEGILENNVDPIDISIVLNEDMQKNNGSSQSFYAHFNCFKQKLYKDLQGYLVTDNPDD
jgi:hypothetical protein